ncbi:hypothetical protein AAE250_14760 [Bacteroides sp. GD17]|jgi:hypothetical protein|uniref:hypothetical protein n=1 Tax=Bacteroides sp. GD17 TaxID=3139826 RepID=UPI0025E5B594|nr:hypothetical protein [uncultured Bacteroides sp.]
MKALSYHHILCLLLGILFTYSAKAQTFFMNGSTYEERCHSLVDHMLQTQPVENGSIKYVSPFYFARLWRGFEVEKAQKKLTEMYQHQLEHVEAFYNSGSDMDFFAHATMHGYLLTKEKMSAPLQEKIKAFMQLGRYTRDGITLNMKLMHQTAGLLCAEEWPDFTDADGKNSAQLKEALHDKIISILHQFITHNCSEADAFTYLGTNLQYVRMLAEFSKDEEIQKAALAAYHHMVAQLLLPWNQGLYCANPPRCKGWKNLYTGNLSTGVQIAQLAWLFYGTPDERIICREAPNHDNFACFNFWMAYQRNVKPLSLLQALNRAKTYPYSFEALRIDSKHYYCRYTYQSSHYGLSTQTVEAFADKLKDFQYTYAFKETKNIHLVWQSDCSEASVFSVCHDNPERPQIYQTKSNKLGYGENPYHRVFGHEKSAVGIYNVAKNYMATPVFYQMYVPFSRQGIKQRMVKNIHGLQWILCHTGSMMFAFCTPEAWTFETTNGKYAIEDHDVLVLKDKKRRRGSWVLETTEITDAYKDAQGNLKAELENFATDIRNKVRFTLSADYETSDTPAISYTNLQGDTLELTFFSPETAYNGQYKLNGTPVQLNTTYISRSKYMEQKAGSNLLLFHTLEGPKSIRLE